MLRSMSVLTGKVSIVVALLCILDSVSQFHWLLCSNIYRIYL